MLFQRIQVALIPLDELADALVQPHDGLVADFRLELRRVRIGLIDVAGLHGQELLLGLDAEGLFDLGDEGCIVSLENGDGAPYAVMEKKKKKPVTDKN